MTMNNLLVIRDVFIVVSYTFAHFFDSIMDSGCTLGWFIKIKSDQIITIGGLLVAH